MKLLTKDSARSPFSRSAKLLLVATILFNLFSLILLAFRFTLPTDGWLAMEPDGFEESGFIYQENVLGAASGLQVGDWVTAVNDTPIDNSAFFMSATGAAAWRAGNTVQYTVQRDGQTLTIEAPLVHEELGSALRAAIFPDLNTVFYYVGMAVFFAISIFAFWQRSDNPAARSLLLMAAFLFNILITLDILPQGIADLYNPVVSFSLSAIILSTFSVLLPPAFIRFGLVFPQPKPQLRQRPWLVYLPYLPGTAVIIAFLNGAFVWGWVWTGTAVLITLLLLLHNAFTMRDAASRGQLRWALGGTILGLGLFSLNYVGVFFVESSVSQLGQILSTLSRLGFSIMGISMAVAMLRYSLFGIDRLVNRTLVYGGLTLCVVAIYVLAVGYLSFLFQTEANLTISLISTGLAAVLFDRLRRILQRGVNRLMYGERDEPYQLLTRLGQQLETALDPSSALALTVESVAQALKLPYAAIALQQGDVWQNTAVYGQPLNEISRFPLIYAGQMIGELLVGSRAANESFTPADQRLLHDLARQIGAVAHAVSLTANLEQARLRLVTERGEARRQLGSDLHDSVGHQLVGLTRQLERAMNMMSDDSVQAESTLAEVNQQLVALTHQVRGLAHQLFPPELELLGLVGALRERVQLHPHLRIALDAPENMPTLPAEIETAVYYIALEALTNIEKHAHAQAGRIRIGLSSESQPLVLQLVVKDDGRGLPAVPNGGLGLLSMQARAAEVGGVCRVEKDEGGGTAVTVRIPCPFKVE